MAARLASLLRRRSRPTAPSPSSSCRRSRRPRTPTAARSACSCPERARPSPASGRSPRSCAAGSSRRSSISTATPTIQLADRPATTTIYVSLPPPGSHHNVTRYPVAIVGPGYRGLLTSGSTRIDGLVSLADIAPTAKAIAAGRDAADPLPQRQRRSRGARPARRPAHARPRRPHGRDARARRLARRVRGTRHPRPPVRWRAVPPCSSLPWRSGPRCSSAPSASSEPSTVIAILAVVTGVGSFLLALRPALLVPAVVALPGRRSSSSSRPGRRSTRWRRSARIPTAAAGSTASRTRSRRSCSRRHSPPRRQQASPAPWRSGSCSSFSSAGAAPAPTGEGSSS